jgi:hypothetical protein
MVRIRVTPWQEALARQNQAELMALIRRVDRQMITILRQASRDISALLAGLPEDGIGAAVRRALYLQQRAAINLRIQQIWNLDITDAILGRMGDSAELLAKHQRLLLSVLGKGAPLGAQTLLDSLQSAMGLGVEAVRLRYLNSIKLSETVFNNIAFASGKIDQIIDAGLAAGSSAREIANAVRSFINPSVPGGTSYAAMRLGRTEINNAYRGMQAQIYADSPWVDAAQWNLSGSHPEADECDGLAEDDSGLGPGIYASDAIPFSPHPQCFCYVTPITPSNEEFIQGMISGQYNNFPSQFGLPPIRP